MAGLGSRRLDGSSAPALFRVHVLERPRSKMVLNHTNQSCDRILAYGQHYKDHRCVMFQRYSTTVCLIGAPGGT